MLRFKTAQLGGNAALMNTPVEEWKQDQLVQSRVLGEAWRCLQPTIATREHAPPPSAVAFPR
jgi:hypothetical protein